eukprot:SAG11_NODE_1919_length_4070_cov_2.351801_5_plen_327_part_00
MVLLLSPSCAGPTDYGESHGWPHVISMYGQFDAVGFAKSAAHLYRTIWCVHEPAITRLSALQPRLSLKRGRGRLENVPLTSADRPPIGPSSTCHIVESWDAIADGTSSVRDIHVYSSGTAIDLAVNGRKLGTQTVGGWHDTDPHKGETPGGVTFSSVAWESGSVTATCHGVNTPSKSMTHERKTSKAASTISLRVDAPSPQTGTGKALLADGQDTALLAAIVMDADGNVDSTSNASITFSIVSGPGKVVATHNGDVQNHEHNLGASHAAYHGLVRGVVRVTENSASPSWVRSRLLHIDAEAAVVRQSHNLASADTRCRDESRRVRD